MYRCLFLASVVGLGFNTVGRADSRGQPVPLSPYAPATAYVPATAANSPVKPASGPAYLPPTAAPVSSYPDAPGACDPIERLACHTCGPEECGWVQADYLLWSVRSGSTPPLITRDVPGTPQTGVGIPGTRGQQTLFGGTGLNGDLRSGFRIRGGYWLDQNRLWGISGDFFFLEPGNDGGRFASPGNPPLSRPFLNAATGQPNAELVSFPSVLSGAVTVRSRTAFGGAGAFVQRNLCCDYDECGHGYRLDLLAGYRYLELNDHLSVREDLFATGAGLVPPGTQIVVRDRFRTENTFHGGLLGLAGDVQRGKWSLNFRGGASFGNMHRELTINGSTAVLVPGQPLSVRPGGLLAQPSNIGRYTSDTFTVVPEVGINLGYQVTSHLRVHVGYTFFYLPNVWRAGDQIDRSIDPAQLRGLASTIGRPAPVLASTGAAVQGINFGMSLRY